MQRLIKKSFVEAKETLIKFLENDKNISNCTEIATMLANTFEAGNKILICGNGGSMCDAVHFAEEFTGRFRKNREALPVISLSDSAHISCVANDFGFNEIFSRGVQAFGKRNDVFIGISTSGNSQNVINAIEMAKKKQLKTILFLGKNGGKLKNMADFEILVEAVTSDRVQEVHMTALHIIIEGVERILFPKNYE